jgi:hypothetical protein
VTIRQVLRGKPGRQGNIYSQAALEGFELTTYQYAVVISKQRVSDRREGSATYRRVM